MRVAYFVNHYPAVSHSFIRREINALERQGVEIERFAIRTDTAELVDGEDKAELEKTRYLLDQSFWLFIRALLIQFVRSPLRFFRSLVTVAKIGWGSDRGLVRHFIYFFEALSTRNVAT